MPSSCVDVIDIDHIAARINEYINGGWAKASQWYKRSGKLPGDEEVDLATMQLLGKVREYIVKNVFRCARNMDVAQMMDSFGSTNPTSDYDVSLAGKDTCHVMWRMYETFLQTYKLPMSIALDVNLYNNGLYMAANSVDHIEGFEKRAFSNRQGDVFTLVPTPEVEDVMKAWAVAKLYEACRWKTSGPDAESDDPDHVWAERAPYLTVELKGRVQAVLEKCESLKDTVTGIVRDHKTPTFVSSMCAKKHDESEVWLSSSEARDVAESYVQDYVFYALQYLYAEQLNAVVYGGPTSRRPEFIESDVLGEIEARVPPYENIADLLSLNMFFSVEAAYTQGTVNVVVHEMQGKQQLSLPENDYVCALIECFADFVTHYGQDDDPARAIKYSKYVYRMMYAGSKAWAARAAAEHDEAKASVAAKMMAVAQKMNEEVVSKRDVRTSVNVAAIGYGPGYALKVRNLFFDIMASEPEDDPSRFVSTKSRNNFENAPLNTGARSKPESGGIKNFVRLGSKVLERRSGDSLATLLSGTSSYLPPVKSDNIGGAKPHTPDYTPAICLGVLTIVMATLAC